MSKFEEMLVKIVIGVAGVYIVALLCFLAYLGITKEPKQDTAEDVMKSCVDTGMYLHKGYAITCRVLVDGSFDPQRGKEAV